MSDNRESSETTRSSQPRCGRARAVIVLAVIPIAAATAGCIWRPDSLSALTLVPAWCWALQGIIATALACRIGHCRFASLLAAFWIVFAIGWIEELPSIGRSMRDATRGAEFAGHRRLRIVSLNCSGNALCLADLRPVNPDVVLLQEAPGDRQLASLVQALFGDEGNYLSGGDTAILARGPIEARFGERGAHFVAGRVTLDDGRRIECVSVRLNPPPSRLDFWRAEFWGEHKEGRAVHRRQLRQIVDRLSAAPSDNPVVIGGDFNTVPFDRALEEFRPRWTDVFSRAGRGLGATGTNDWPLFRVDQVWTDARIAPTHVSAQKSVSSDHRLVVCDVELLPE